jgi:hypothetical protein
MWRDKLHFYKATPQKETRQKVRKLEAAQLPVRTTNVIECFQLLHLIPSILAVSIARQSIAYCWAALVAAATEYCLVNDDRRPTNHLLPNTVFNAWITNQCSRVAWTSMLQQQDAALLYSVSHGIRRLALACVLRPRVKRQHHTFIKASQARIFITSAGVADHSSDAELTNNSLQTVNTSVFANCENGPILGLLCAPKLSNVICLQWASTKYDSYMTA